MQDPIPSTNATSLQPAFSRAARATGVRLSRAIAFLVLWTSLLPASLLPSPARAADGCLVLLCLAAPSWQNIAQCVDPVRQVLRDLGHSRPFPSCAMSGGGNAASNQPASAPARCPIQYTRSFELQGLLAYDCNYAGVVDVDIGGALWSRVWWNPPGDSVTECTPAARARLGTWDTRFDDDYGRWLAAQPPAVPPGPGF